jgi:tripartite-type tricarboxylate transporter receptor subunit TctC
MMQHHTTKEAVVTTLIRALVLAAMLVCAAEAAAQTYPSRSVRLIVPFAAGGPTDVIARIVAQRLSESFGQQVYVEDVPGAGGNTGTAMAAKAAADGYTLLVVSTGFIVNPSMYAKVPYDPIRDFAPITLIASSPNVLSVNPEVPARSVKDLIALVKASPGKYSFAQPGTGSTPHLAGELFKLKFDLDLVMVPFNGAALAINSTLGGHTPIVFTALPPAMANIRDGKLRGLAVLSERRAAVLPDVPTMAEAGVPDQESDTLTGLVAPAGTPPEIVARWNGEIVKLVALPDVKQRLSELGFEPVADTPAHFGARIKAEIAKWAKVVHDANIKAD